MFAVLIGAILLGYPVSFTLTGIAVVFAALGWALGIFDLSLLGALGHRVGETLLSYMGRKLARDYDRLDAEETQRLLGVGREHGIHLTPAELTDLSSMKAQQRVAGQNLDIGDDVNRFYEQRATEQIDPAIARYFEGISDIEGDDVARLMRGAEQSDRAPAARVRRERQQVIPIGELGDAPVHRREVQVSRPFTIHVEVDAAPVCCPCRAAYRPVELLEYHPRLRAVGPHEVQIRGLIRLDPIVEADVGDKGTVRRHSWA